MKDHEDQRPPTRRPRQARARHKVELMLEAAMRLLDEGRMALLTTNAVAETAGVSIGTLYQYFPGKAAILDALADQEMAAISARVLSVLQDAEVDTPRERIGRIVKAVTSGYGERPRVQRLLLEHSLAQGGVRLAPLVQEVIALLTRNKLPAAQGAMSMAEAFVLTNAFAGVMRAMIARPDPSSPPPAELEAAMARLFAGFVEGTGAGATTDTRM